MAPGVPESVFREVMSAFPAGVTIVTAKSEHDTPEGVTVSAFASISLEPPLIMVSLRPTSRTAAAIRARKAFAVHILDGSHAELAVAFSQNEADKFQGVSYSWSPGGVPILDVCPLCLECSLEDERLAGDHVILLGRVGHVHLPDSAAANPMVYYRRAYRLLTPPESG